MRKKKRNAGDFADNSHVSDTTILLALSGELSGHVANAVTEHLHSCWPCRVRLEKFEHAIQDVVDFRDALIGPQLPLPNGPRAVFLSRLDQAVVTMGRQSPWKRIKATVSSSFSLELPRPMWIAALVILFIVAIAAYISPSRPSISADDLLRQADHAENSRLEAVVHPVVYRRVNLLYKGRSIDRSVYHDTVSNRSIDAGGPREEILVDLESRLKTSHFDLQEPLSVPAYIRWRKSLPEKNDDVIGPSDGIITVQTTTTAGPLRQINLQLRDSDLHPLSETLRFEDQNTVEIAEVNYEVIPFASVQPGVFTPAFRLPVRVAAPALIPTGPSLSELLDAEVQARIVLHAFGADRGEQIEVSTNLADKKVVVSGLVESNSRKNQLSQALDAIPAAKVAVSTVDDADSPDLGTATDNRPVIAVESTPPLGHQLESVFPDPAVRAEFVNRSLEQARTALSTAWALRRLSERYSSDVTAHLSAGTQRNLEVLIREQVSTLQTQLESLRTSLSPVVCTSQSEIQDQRGYPSDLADWHWTVDTAFSSTQRVHDDIAVLLTGSAVDTPDSEALVRDLQTALQRMAVHLPILGRQVSGKFLGSSDLNADVR